VNLLARRKLSYFLNTARSLDLANAIAEGQKLYGEYLQAPEGSLLAQSEYLRELVTPLQNTKNILYSKKNWWGKLLGFFGFAPAAEGPLNTLIKKIERSRGEAKSKHHLIYHPNWFFRFLYWLGLRLTEIKTQKPYEGYSTKEQLTYLSHHLMGTSDLTEHTILHGKIRSHACRDFINDLNDFIGNPTIQLDDQTRKLLLDVREQILAFSKLAQKIDSLYLRRKLHKDPTYDELYVKDLAYEIQKSLCALSPGQSMIFPHGFTSSTAGHGTVIECQKADDEHIIFRIINTGFGEDQIESYKTMVFSLLSSKRPIKVTSALSIEELTQGEYIEKILTSLMSEQGAEQMNSLFSTLYHANKLHDDEYELTLQTNGTCAHSSLLAWIQMKIPKPIYALFQLVTLQGANKRLQQFEPTWEIQDTTGAIPALRQAGERTVRQVKADLTQIQAQLIQEREQLKSQLSNLLQKKKKSIEDIPDFEAYSKKKTRNKAKLTLEEQALIAAESPVTSWPKTNAKSQGVISGLFALFGAPKVGSSGQDSISDRAQKAIIAKKIHGHDETINASVVALT
jgi:hypothetical protein